jgi:hypothetical protein
MHDNATLFLKGKVKTRKEEPDSAFPATEKVEIRSIVVQSQPGQIVQETLP